MSVAFTNLFERSRYSSHGRRSGLDERTRKQRMEQQERFAVGMIGFTLRHDPNFREHFVTKVGGSREAVPTGGWEILVEPDNWGDLVMKHRALNSVLVAEFKIGSTLKNHQNPSKQKFTLPSENGDCAGYGWEIEQMASRENWKKSKYVTIEKNASWSQVRKKINGLVCLHLEWRELLRTGESQESNLETDVYDCLSHFGISAFISKKMKHKQLADQATQPLALLIGVLDEVNQVEFKKHLLDSGAEFIGINIRRQEFPRIADVVKSDEVAGWFGYDFNDDLGAGLSVWFYCADSNKRIKPTVRDRIKKMLRSAGFAERSFSERDECLRIFCKANESGGDHEWFVKVLSKLNT